jgi:sarcosine oxidase subunit gamma
VAEYSLTATSPLGGIDRTIGTVTLREAPDTAIVSLAIPLGGEAAAFEAIRAAFGIAPPAVGMSCLSADRAARLIRLGSDQMFIMLDHPGTCPATLIAEKLGDTAYLTDQSDVWAVLDISGAGTRSALRRICPIDLHPDSFATGQAARTAMEHIGAIIIRTGSDAFTLLSASSSALSFLEAVELSIINSSGSRPPT